MFFKWTQKFGSFNCIMLTVWLLTCIVCYGFFVGADSLFEKELAARMEKINSENNNLAHAIGQNINRTFSQADSILLFMKTAIEANGSVDPALLELLKTFQMKDDIEQIAVADARGNLLFSAAPQTRLINISDREYFAVQASEDTSKVFISSPHVSRTTKNDTLFLSRRINDANGKFAGVVYFGLSTHFIQEEFRQMEMSTDSSIILVGTDGRFMARFPPLQSSEQQDYYKTHTVLSYINQGLSTGMYESPGVESNPLIAAFYVLPNYPAFVGVATSKKVALQDVAARHSLYRLAVAGLSTFLFLTLIALSRLGLKQYKTYLALQESEERFKEISANAPVAIESIDKNNNVLFLNKKFTELFGYSIKDIPTISIWMEKAYPDEVYRNQIIKVWSDDIVEYGQENNLVKREFNVRCSDGTTKVVEFTFSVTNDNIYVIFNDITERKQMAERLEFLSLRDSLTGVYNRAYFEEETQRLQSKGHAGIGMFICDVDGLKLINDTLGHDYGDELLKKVANILNTTIVQPDFTARIGGDEFAVVLSMPTTHRLEALEKQYYKAVANYNKENNLPLSLSLGWAIDLQGANIDQVFKEADHNMYRQKMHHLQSNRSFMVQTLMKALEARDHITEGHADRLGKLMDTMGKRLQLSQGALSDLWLLAKFHDIGKVGIPDSILNKPGALTEEEGTIMRRHCEIGFRIARSCPDLEPIADWILKHQEHWNGKGYPLGLSGEDIPVECRILAIIDAYDAMTSDRPYRKAMSYQDAIAEIRRCSGTQFDPELAEKFIDMVSRL